MADFKRDDKGVIFKEMALFKVVGNTNKIKKAIKACKKYNAVILDKTKKSNVIQITALREIDKMAKNLKNLGWLVFLERGCCNDRGDKVFN